MLPMNLARSGTALPQKLYAAFSPGDVCVYFTHVAVGYVRLNTSFRPAMKLSGALEPQSGLALSVARIPKLWKSKMSFRPYLRLSGLIPSPINVGLEPLL